MEGKEFPAPFAEVVFGIAKRCREGKKARIFSGNSPNDEADKPFGSKEGNDAVGFFVVLGAQNDPFDFFCLHGFSLHEVEKLQAVKILF